MNDYDQAMQPKIQPITFREVQRIFEAIPGVEVRLRLLTDQRFRLEIRRCDIILWEDYGSALESLFAKAIRFITGARL